MRWIRLKKRAVTPDDAHENEVSLYADADGALQTVDDEGNVSPVGGGGGGLVAEVSITAAAFLNCHDVPIEILPTPGPGNAYVIDRVEAFVQPDEAGYVFAASLWMTIGDMDGDVRLYEPESLKGVLAAAHANVQHSFEIGPSVAYGDFSAVADYPLMLRAQAGDPVDGEADFDLTISYHIISAA